MVQHFRQNPWIGIGIKEQNLFFNKLFRKIDYHLDQLKNDVTFGF